jgi:hypothetical protein
MHAVWFYSRVASMFMGLFCRPVDITAFEEAGPIQGKGAVPLGDSARFHL